MNRININEWKTLNSSAQNLLEEENKTTIKMFEEETCEIKLFEETKVTRTQTLYRQIDSRVINHESEILLSSQSILFAIL